MELHEKTAGTTNSPEAKTGEHKVSNSEKAVLIGKVHRLPEKTAIKFRYAAIGLSWVSVITTFAMGSGALVFGALHDSQLLFSFGLDSILDCTSSIIILWRFHGSDTLYSEIKELRACVMIGVMFVLSGLLLAVRCIVALNGSDAPEKPTVTLILSVVNVVVSLFLGSSKVYVGYKLESRALIIDSVITFIGFVMSSFTLVFSAVYKHNKRLWFLDDTFGIICSIFLFAYGIRVIIISKRELTKSVGGV